jgi:FkbM family methyltransferase
MRLLVHRFLRRLGLELVRYDGRRFVARKRVEVIRAAGVNVVLDVGAGVGQFAGWLRGEGYVGRIISFEPVEETFAELQRRAAADPTWTCVNVALGERSGEGVVNVAGNLWSSSLLAMTREHEAASPASAYVAKEKVRVARLDSLDVIRPDERAYLKVDVQGAEGQVLDGAAGVFDRIIAAELELSLVELYEGQELLPTLRERMRTEGFVLVWLGESIFRDPTSDEILAVDGIFVRQARSRRLGVAPSPASWAGSRPHLCREV